MNLKDEVIKSLELQKEQFGDELYSELKIPKFEDQSLKKENILGKQVVVTPKINSISTSISSEQLPTPAVYNSATSLDELKSKICNCLKCPLGSARKSFVFGEGSANAKVMLIGEGPGADEDLQGRPFVGRAGQLLTDILKAINFSREEVYIANIVKCRPPMNRTPFDSEITECIPYLIKQIDLIKPAFILCLGSTAAQALLGKRGTLGSFRNIVTELYGAQVMVTYHPAALLRQQTWKRDCWEDVQSLRKLYDKKFPS